MSHIQTVTGAKPPDTIDFCHCHEHLLIKKGQSYAVNPVLWMEDSSKTLQELQDFKSVGGTTIVDAQPIGCGRMEGALITLSEKSGVDLIASTGFHKIMFYPKDHWIFQYSCEAFTRILIDEIQTGMYASCDESPPHNMTDAKAGIIKCAFDTCGFTSQYKKLFDAATDVARITNVPMMVHIEQGSDPLQLADYLLRRRIDLNRVIFCHLDRACDDISVHRKLAGLGIYLEYDTIGRFKYHDDQTEANIILELLNAGFENRLLFSLDTTRARLKAYTPEAIGLTYLIASFLPTLRASGVTEEQIRKMSCENCRQILAI